MGGEILGRIREGLAAALVLSDPDPKKSPGSKRLIGPQGLSPGRLLRAALRHPDEGPTFARLCGGIPDATRGPAVLWRRARISAHS